MLTLLLCMLMAATTTADEADKYWQMSIDELLQVELTIAAKNAEDIKHSAASVSYFSADELRTLNITRLMDLMDYVPGFYNMMNSVEGNQSHLVMRGHAQKYANTLLVLLNGQRINDDYTGGINYLMRYINLTDVERVEVIRGPGSAIYGSNAFSGVINIITRVRDHLTLGLGNLSSKQLALGKSIGFGDWQLGLGFQLEKDSGDNHNKVFDRNNIQTQTTDPIDSQSARIELYSSNTHLQAQWLGSERDNYYLFRRLRDGVTTIELDHYLISANHQFNLGKNRSLTLAGGWQKANRVSLTALVPQGEAPFETADFLFGEDFNYQSSNLSADLSWYINEQLTLNSGLFFTQSQVPGSYLRSNFDLFGDFSQLPEVVTFSAEDQRVVLDKKRQIKSIYAQAQWQVNPLLKITAGLRFDGYNDVENALMPRLAGVYQASKQHTLKLLYAQGYRVPSLGDLYDEESGLTVGNQSLHPSETQSTELIHIYSNDELSLITTLFANEHENLIGFKTSDANNVYLDNVAANTATGLEMELNWKVGKHWQSKLAYTHLFENHTTLSTTSNLPRSEEIAPRHYLNFQQHFHYDNWHWHLNGTWRNAVDVLDGGGLLLLGGGIEYQFSDSLHSSFTASNLLNKDYDTSSYIPLGQDADGKLVQHYPARGTEFKVQFRYLF